MQTKQDIKDKYDISEYVSPTINIPDIKIDGLVCIVGQSASGKTTILNSLLKNNKKLHIDFDKSLIDNFSDIESAENLLLSFGLRSIPAWFRKPNEISNGERHRFECALSINQGIFGIDEFTSVVDRDTAKSLSVGLRKSIDNGFVKNIVVASCHRDILEWLQPDLIYDTDICEAIEGRSLRRPKIEIKIEPTTIKDWILFKNHHYLDSKVSKSCHFYIAKFNEKKIGFVAVIHGTGRDIKSYWRESRIVILPEFQGLGLGYRLSCAVAEEYTSRGLRYFSKTAHPALGEKRNKDSDKWRPTSNNMKARRSYLKKDGTARKQNGFGKTEKEILRDYKRICYSHEYIG